MSEVLGGGRLLTPAGVVDPGWLRVEGGRIAEIGTGAAPAGATDLGGQWVLPGFIDMHVHGGGGTSFTEGGAEDAARAAAFHRAHGSTRIIASLVTAPADELERRVAMLADLADDGVIDGIHLEGPFLSAARCGAQDPRYLVSPDTVAFGRWLKAARGHLKMITVAPELPGALDVVRAAAEAGVIAAAGHTDADAEATLAAVDAGVTQATHLFNGMRPLHHREPGPVAALLDRDEVACEVIADGTHLAELTVRLIARAAGPGRLVLITDAMAAAGMSDGEYRLGSQAVTVSGGVARLAGDGTVPGSIAGSTATMASVVRHAITAAGLGVADVAAAASGTPARLLGLADRTGMLAPGMDADLVVLDSGWCLTAVMRRGERVSLAGGPRGGSGRGLRPRRGRRRGPRCRRAGR